MGTKRILAFFLTVLLCISLCACGEENPIAGSWKGTLDYSRILQEELSDQEIWQTVPIEGVRLEILFDFREDGSFSSQISRQSVDAMVEKLLELAVQALARNLKDQGSIGYTPEQLRKRLESSIDISALTAPLEFTFGSGYYVFANSCIYIGSQERSLRVNPVENAAEILNVSLGAGVITVHDLHSQDSSAEGFLPGLLPFELVKQP